MYGWKHDLLVGLMIVAFAIVSFVAYKVIGDLAIVLFIVLSLIIEITGGIFK